MNFDFGAVLARAGRITWKYKSLWLAGVVITLISFLSVPINLFLNPGITSMGDPAQVQRQLPLLFLTDGLIILLSLLNIPVFAFGLSIPSLATVQSERGAERIGFGEALRGVLPYFWRILAVFLLITVGMFVVMVVLFGCIGILTALTLGFGALCIIPLSLLLIPAILLVYAFMEQAMAAVLVDNLGVGDALRRGWNLMRQNLLVVILMGLIIYVGIWIVSVFISVPMMIPMFKLMGTIMAAPSSPPDLQEIQNITRSMLWWMLAFSPLYALVQGVLLTFMQSAWMLTYMRLTKPQENAPVMLEANA